MDEVQRLLDQLVAAGAPGAAGGLVSTLYDRYGLGLLEVETPAGRLVGNAGGIPALGVRLLSGEHP